LGKEGAKRAGYSLTKSLSSARPLNGFRGKGQGMTTRKKQEKKWARAHATWPRQGLPAHGTCPRAGRKGICSKKTGNGTGGRKFSAGVPRSSGTHMSFPEAATKADAHKEGERAYTRPNPEWKGKAPVSDTGDRRAMRPQTQNAPAVVGGALVYRTTSIKYPRSNSASYGEAGAGSEEKSVKS